jgi:hypothetical protein
MNFIKEPSNATQFSAFIQCSNQERLRLLKYIQWLLEEDVYEKIKNHPKFAPSSLWQGWINETFLGFSADRLMLKSGHCFGHMMDFKKKGLLGFLKNTPFTPKNMVEKFSSFYPFFNIPHRHQTFLDLHPIPYMRSLEAWALASIKSTEFVIEIGAGAGVNTVLNHDIYPGTHSVIIDLPETVFAGFLFISIANPNLRICLPNEINSSWKAEDYDVTFLLPTQSDIVPSSKFDLAFNMSSFQEMDIEIVNNYIAYLKDRLLRGGSLISVNHDRARHIKNNCFEKYDFNGFSIIKKQTTGYANWTTSFDKSPISHLFVQAKKN